MVSAAMVLIRYKSAVTLLDSTSNIVDVDDNLNKLYRVLCATHNLEHHQSLGLVVIDCTNKIN